MSCREGGSMGTLIKAITKDNICATFLGLALLACIGLGYNDNVACTIAGSLGGVITGKAIAQAEFSETVKRAAIDEVAKQLTKIK
jgi:hypothetical protein